MTRCRFSARISAHPVCVPKVADALRAAGFTVYYDDQSFIPDQDVQGHVHAYLFIGGPEGCSGGELTKEARD
ncbi:hypothetical protein NDR87_18835 [Nocardia sp. CDC159]|uniref:Uncharacterized protein n=1 Tax=Nocardia pulmonis TaxID=2951408 RepID=A0A9X2EBQ9_9NOCA|nr:MULTISPECIES: hypothetical protein [Nocardia]MCM6776253.1 hypothetical protein [Nocardia pulmonis]MCM6788421.1 hypothetical protein [Nocardia sp. CDC159]